MLIAQRRHRLVVQAELVEQKLRLLLKHLATLGSWVFVVQFDVPVHIRRLDGVLAGFYFTFGYPCLRLFAKDLDVQVF